MPLKLPNFTKSSESNDSPLLLLLLLLLLARLNSCGRCQTPWSLLSSSSALYVTIPPNLVHLSLPPAPVSFSSFLGNSTKLVGLPRTWDGLELSSEADGDDGSRKEEHGKERVSEREPGTRGERARQESYKGRREEERRGRCRRGASARSVTRAAAGRKRHLRNRCRVRSAWGILASLHTEVNDLPL
ncbi:hypothetical protein P5V15_007269 [Pogonomyrmex californicus]